MVDEPPVDSLTLEQIEGRSWGDPPPDATALMTRVHELRRKPVGTMGAEDLRVLIAQKVGLDTVVPVALARLTQDPLLEGEYYPGDVLAAVLAVPASYWAANPAQQTALERVIGSIDPPDAELAGDIRAYRERTAR